MIKLIFKILAYIISIICVLLTVYFLFAVNGIDILKSLFEGGFIEGIKDFFIGIWEGFKSVVGL